MYERNLKRAYGASQWQPSDARSLGPVKPSVGWLTQSCHRRCCADAVAAVASRLCEASSQSGLRSPDGPTDGGQLRRSADKRQRRSRHSSVALSQLRSLRWIFSSAEKCSSAADLLSRGALLFVLVQHRSLNLSPRRANSGCLSFVMREGFLETKLNRFEVGG